MLIFALDTSGDICSAAIFDAERELSTLNFRHDRQLSERLPAIIDFMLADRKLALRDIEAFAVGLGPGSFTGVRIGVTLAKTFAHVLGRPLIGVSSLDAVAAAVPAGIKLGIAAVAPTRRTEVVAAYYLPGETSPVADPGVVLNRVVVSEARAALSLAPDAPLLVVGEAAANVEQDTPEEFRSDCAFLVQNPSASHVARLAAIRLSGGLFDNPYALTPLYVTPTPVG